MSNDPSSQEHREARIPFEQSIVIQYARFDHFIEEVSANLSPGGVFVRTNQPKERGTRFDFEFRLGDDFPLFRGQGEVVWVRRMSAGVHAPVGMGVRFLKLDDASRRLIVQVIAKHVGRGGEPFDLTDGPDGGKRKPVLPPDLEPMEAPPATAGSSQDAEPVAGVDGGEPRPVPSGKMSLVRLGLLLLLSSLFGAVLVLAFQQIFIQPSIDNLEMRVEELSSQPALPLPAPDPAAAVEPVSESATAAEDQLDPTADEEDAKEVVRDWARSWSEKRFDDYLAHYARSFAPPDGLARDEWETLRRERILRPGAIQVTVTSIRERDLSTESKELSFTQSFRSERYSDLVRKTLRMVLEDGRWRIAEERVER